MRAKRAFFTLSFWIEFLKKKKKDWIDFFLCMWIPHPSIYFYQFDQPIVLAITNRDAIFDYEKIDPNQIDHVIDVGYIGGIIPYEDRLTLLKKRHRSTRETLSLEEVTEYHCFKVERIEALVLKLRVLLNTIRMNFLTESIHCRINDDDDCYFVTRSIPKDPEDYAVYGECYTYYNFSDNGGFTIENYDHGCTYYSKTYYDNLCEIDILNFCRENKYNKEIFKTKYDNDY